VLCLRLRDLLEVRFTVIFGPTEVEVRSLAALVHGSKCASAKVHDESARSERKRGDWDLDTATRLFKVADRIASFEERADLRSPGAGGIHQERVSAETDVLVPAVPRSLSKKRRARRSSSRYRLGCRI